MRINFYGHNFMGEEGDGAGGGGAAAPVPTPTPAPAGGGEATPPAAPAPAPAGTPAAGSVLANGAPAEPANIQPHERFAEKYRVFKEDGTFDFEATALKSEEARAALEKKLGTGEVAPATVDEYKVADIGDMSADEIMKDPIAKSFLARAHAKSMTNAQVQDVLEFAMQEWLPAVLDSGEQYQLDQCEASLRETWNTDESYKANTAGAYKAFMAFADPADKDQMDAIGNHPVVVRLLANVAKEMREDTGANAGALGQSSDVAALMASEAYTNPKHPEHAAVSAKIRSHYERTHGTAAAL